MVDNGVDVIMDEMAAWADKADPPQQGNGAEAQLLMELLRDHLGVYEVGELTAWGLRQLLLSVYPRKVTVLDADDLVDVLPTVRDLVRFGEETGRLKADAAFGLRLAIDEIEPEFVSTVMDSENWGMARSFVQAMAADGVDLSNSEEVQRWIATHSSTLGGPAPADPREVNHGVAEALGLPDRLAPLRLPPEAELADAARSTALLSRAAELAAWTGDARETDDDELTALDTVAAAEAVGIPLPGTSEPDGVLPGMPAKPLVKAMRDVPELQHLWRLAVSADLIEVCDGHVHVDDDPVDLSDDDDVLAAWEGACSYVVGGWLATDAETHDVHGLNFASAGLVVFVMLFLAGEPVDLAELRTDMQDIAVADAPPEEAGQAWASWTTSHGDPPDTLLARLSELGAVTVRDGTAELTALGMFGARAFLDELGVEVPLLPPVDEMAAADLVDAAVAGLSDEDLQAETAAWLDPRDPASAAEELLALAAEGPAAVRLVATSIAAEIGGAAEPHWRTALDRIELRPYAKIALARIAGLEAGDVLPGAEPEPSDAAWLLIDTVMATADEDDDDAVLAQFGQAVPAGHEQEMLDAVWRVPHPDAHDVLSMLGRIHPDKKIAKQARKAAFKARSQAARMQLN